jgi:hypothetical protein
MTMEDVINVTREQYAKFQKIYVCASIVWWIVTFTLSMLISTWTLGDANNELLRVFLLATVCVDLFVSQLLGYADGRRQGLREQLWLLGHREESQ